jgi:hypothetical protein
MIGNDERSSEVRSSRRGVLTILAIFAVGGLFVAGLYVAARRGLSEEYKSAQLGAPPRRLRFASIDLAYDRNNTHRVIDQLYNLKPDFVMVQRVTRHEAYKLAQALEMRHGGTVQMFYSLNDPAAERQPGNAVLAKWPLYQGRTMAKRHPRQFGIFVESVVDGRRFVVGSWDLAEAADDARREIEMMIESWTRGQRPPLILGGDGGTTVLPEVLMPVTATGGIHASRAWRVLEAGVMEIAGSGAMLTWADVSGE